MNKKFIIIIGAMKSATSAIFSLLSQHPEICPSHPKEPQFFVQKDYQLSRLGEYDSFWECPGEQVQYYMEASTSYTKLPVFPNAALNIKQAGIKVKFIYVLRHPIERIESHVKMARYKHWKIFNENNQVVDHIIDTSKYYFQIREYFDRFPKEDILLIHFEDFKDDPEGTINLILQFLGIQKTDRIDYDKMFRHSGVMYGYEDKPVLKMVRRLMGRAELLVKNYAPILRLLHTIINNLDQVIIGNYTLEENEKQRIISILKDDLINLRDNFGFDISKWNILNESKG